MESQAFGVVVMLLAAFGTIHLVRLARTLPPETPPYGVGVPDMVVGGLLAAWFVAMIASAGGEAPAVTIEAVIGSGVIYGGLVAIVVGFLAVRQVSPVSMLRLRWPTWRSDLPWVTLAFLSALPVIGAAQWIGTHIGAASEANQPLLDFWLEHADLTNRAAVVLMAVVVAPVAEEVLFRGYLYNIAKGFAGRWWGMAATSLLFAAVHIHLPVFVGLFLLAMALNLVYEKSGSLWPAICLHALFNALSLAAATAWPEAA